MTEEDLDCLEPDEIFTEVCEDDDASTTRKQAKVPVQRYQLLLQPVLMPRISTGCKNSWYIWPAAIKGKVFGTGTNATLRQRGRLFGTGWYFQPVPIEV